MTTENVSPADLEAFRRWQQANPTAAPGVYWLDVGTSGNAEYDAAILLRVLPDGQTLRVEVKHSGWVQELWNYIPRAGRRPAAGNGCYAGRLPAQSEYYGSPDRRKDLALVAGKIPAEAMKDARVSPIAPEPTAKATTKAKKAAPKGMTPAA